ncbi:MAG: hypothetical protein WD875_03835 [Pirellulales bacterium]
MDYLPIDRLWIASDGVQTVWTVLWLVLAAVTVTLVLLMYTRWGRSRPLEKCALLSLLAHALLAGVCTSVQLAGAARGVPQEDRSIALAQLVSEIAADDAADDASDTAAEPRDWETPAASPPLAPDVELDRQRSVDSAALVRQVSATSDSSPAPLRSQLDAPRTPQPQELAAAVETPAPQSARIEAQPIEPAGNVARSAVAPSVVDGVASPQPRRESSADDIIDRTATEPLAPGAAALAGTPDRQLRAAMPTPDELDAAALPRRAAVGSDAIGSLAPREAIAEASPSPAGIRPAGGGDAQGKSNAAAVPDIYKARSAPNRAQIAAAGGGSAETEAAVDRALAWLAAHQSADGRWNVARLEGGLEPRTAGHDRQGAGIGADTGVTGLALLAFLGAGHTHLEGDHRDTVRRGLEFLLNAQDRRGSVEGDARLFAKMYCHGMGALALSEAYAMTGDVRLRDAVRDAVAFTAAAQHTATGGWRYLPAQPGDNSPGSLGDMSQHGWQVMILKSARLAGVDVSEVTLSRAARFVQSTASGTHGGLSSYRPRERASGTMTAEALVCRMFLDMPRGGDLDREAGDLLLSELPSAERPNFYYWYYGTLAMHDIQGEHWRQWNEAMQRTLLESQRGTSDGGGDGGGDGKGSWDPDPIWGGYGGRTYSTALAALSLEVYYRYLPLYKPAETARRDGR